jgi:two-component system sensor histidine kinase AtoS
MAPQAPVVLADGDRIKQVLINLVLNAIQATPEGGEVSLATRVVFDHDRKYGRLEVRDTGVGISKERLDHIFDPFFTTKDKGTGLGLAIAHQIIAEHGGRISVESSAGTGAVFRVDIGVADGGAVEAARGQLPEGGGHLALRR